MVWQKNMDISIQTAVDNPFATPVAHDFGASDNTGAHNIGLTMGDSFMLSRGPFASSGHTHYQVPMSGTFPWFVAPLAKTRADERASVTERHGGRRRAPHKAVKDPELLEVQRAVTGALIVVRNLSFPKDMPQSKSRDTLGATSSVMASVLRLMQAYPDAFPGRLAERIHEKLTKIVRHFLSWKNREFFFEEDITEPFKECIAILQKARDAMSPDVDHLARASSKLHLVDKVEELNLLCAAVCVAKTRAHEVETTRAHFLLLTEPGSVTQTDLQGSLEVLQPITLVAAKCRRLASEILDLLVKLKEMTKTLVEVRSEIEVAATVNWIVGHYIYIELLVLPRIVERLRGDFFRKGAEASLEALLHHACHCVGPRSPGELQLFNRIHNVVSHIGRALKTHRPLMQLKEEDLLREVDAAVASITTVHAILKELTNRGQKPSYHPVVIKPFLDELQNKITDRKATLRLLDALLDRMAIDRREDPKHSLKDSHMIEGQIPDLKALLRSADGFSSGRRMTAAGESVVEAEAVDRSAAGGLGVLLPQARPTGLDSGATLYQCSSSSLQHAHNQYLLLQARQQLVRTLQQQPKIDVLRERYQRTLQQRPRHQDRTSLTPNQQISSPLDLKPQVEGLTSALQSEQDRQHPTVAGELSSRLDSQVDFSSSVNSQVLCEDSVHPVFPAAAVDAFQLPPTGYRALFSESSDVSDTLNTAASPWATAPNASAAEHPTLLQRSPDVEASQAAEGESGCFDVTQAALDYIARSMAQTSLGHLPDVEAASPPPALDAKATQV